MTLADAPSGRAYELLPIDNGGPFPQTVPYVFAGVRYTFRLYMNTPEGTLGDLEARFTLPDAQRHLVVRCDASIAGSEPRTVFLRKVVPSLEYEVGIIALYFPSQIIACRNVNGVGVFGSNVIGGIAAR
jgi:hypothetical protein